MRLVSTRESIRAEEVSGLAITETAIASLISLLVAYRFHSLGFILLSAGLAPLLLLRTDASAGTGLLYASKGARVVIGRPLAILRYFSRKSDERRTLSLSILLLLSMSLYTLVFALIITPLFVVAITFVKIFVTVLFLVRHPFASIGAIPENWRKVVLCTDSFTIPEILPRIEEVEYEYLYAFRLSTLFKSLKSAPGISIFLFPLLLSVLFVSSAYRFSLKSTSIIWSPLAWAFHPIQRREAASAFCLSYS
jgi:hypothetical protein